MAKKKKKLTNEEMIQMEMNNIKVDKLALELENMRLKAELEVRAHNDRIKAKAEELKNEQKRRKEYVNRLKSDLGIETEKFSFNPDTGEIENGD